MSWTLRITRSAQKEMAALPAEVFDRLDRAILKLEEDPYGVGTLKLRGFKGYRLRVGRYRALYDVDKLSRTVTVFAVRHRREAYR